MVLEDATVTEHSLPEEQFDPECGAQLDLELQMNQSIYPIDHKALQAQAVQENGPI